MAKKKAPLGKNIGSIGGGYPYIEINGYGPFTVDEILFLHIECTDFLPTIHLIIKPGSGLFITKHFPKDGDLINLFIRSREDTFKPIKNDYYITQIRTSASTDAEVGKMEIELNGVLRVPMLFTDVCKAKKEKTSYEALLSIAEDLKLGFSSNQDMSKMDDKQTWIAPYITYKQWIQDITSHAYSDDDSFYEVWIDFYYNLSFINMNQLAAVEDKLEPKKGLTRNVYQNDFDATGKSSHTKSEILLSNDKDYMSTNYYFDSASIVNTSGVKNIKNGYSRNFQYYEKISEESKQWKIDPVITKSVEKTKVVMKGRKSEDWYQKEIKSVWEGIQYALPIHNTHNYFKHSKIQNLQNNNALDKLNMELKLPNVNFNFYKGQVVPVTFVLSGEPSRIREAGFQDDDPANQGWGLDRFLTGQYIILGIEFEWRKGSDEPDHEHGGRYDQYLTIGRREWTMPDENLPRKKTLIPNNEQ